MSVGPPGGKPTNSRMGLLGYAPADALRLTPAASAQKPTANSRDNPYFMNFPLFPGPYRNAKTVAKVCSFGHFESLGKLPGRIEKIDLRRF
ncbi:hypothetical protein D3C86_1900500 [compost metagenome]